MDATQYTAEIHLTIKYPSGLEEEFKRICALDPFFNAVPGNHLRLCKTDDSWHFGEITSAAASPDYVHSAESLTIFCELDLEDEEDDQLLDDIQNILTRVGWECVGTNEDEESDDEEDEPGKGFFGNLLSIFLNFIRFK